MQKRDLLVVPLHKNKEYTLECCKLINDEWKRSETARMRSLESSSDKLPTNLILLQTKTVIGHLKLSHIPSIGDACFVESVVIDKKLRGRGLGTILMLECEKYCTDFLHLKTIYLSTKGQEQFYSKLGYRECQPISIYGSHNININTDNLINKIKNQDCTTAPVPPPLPIINIKLNNTIKTFMKKDLI